MGRWKFWFLYVIELLCGNEKDQTCLNSHKLNLDIKMFKKEQSFYSRYFSVLVLRSILMYSLCIGQFENGAISHNDTMALFLM